MKLSLLAAVVVVFCSTVAAEPYRVWPALAECSGISLAQGMASQSDVLKERSKEFQSKAKELAKLQGGLKDVEAIKTTEADKAKAVRKTLDVLSEYNISSSAPATEYAKDRWQALETRDRFCSQLHDTLVKPMFSDAVNAVK